MSVIQNQSSSQSKRPSRRIVVLSGGSFPTRTSPVHGVFVKERMRFVAQTGTEVRVVSPTPYFPPIKLLKRWYAWSQFPKHELVDGLQVVRPRYLLLPKIGGYWHAGLMYPAACSALKRLQSEFDFELIDAHFAYPSGVAAVQLGKRFDKPVVITGRGSDIIRFPDLPIVGPQIRKALQQATRLIAVSQEIADRMESLGANPERISVIPNGVDTEKFYPLPRNEARQKLDIPVDRKLILAVGYRLELKGFHLLVDALPKIHKCYPDAMIVIVGGQARWAADYLPKITERIKANHLEDHVLVAGSCPQEELRYWYSAADLLSINSSREGSPNVLMEALACGLPAVATPVGGIPNLLSENPIFGRLLPERSSDAAAQGIIETLANSPDRKRIRELIEQRSWLETARSVNAVFEQAIEEYHYERKG